MSPKSLKARLLLGISLCLILLVVAGGAGVYFFFRAHLYKELDHALYDKLRFLRASCVQREGEVVFDLTLSVWSQVQDDHDPEYFQMWLANGETLHRSWEAPAGDLPNLGAGSPAPVYGDLILPSGLAGRVAGQSFIPHQGEGDDDPVAVSVAVAHDTGRIIKGLAELWRAVLIWGVVSGGLVLAAAYTIVKRNLRPLVELSGQIDAIPVGAEQARFDLPDAPEELNPVVERLNALMDRVDAALANERQFTANAAHEMRNPLAAIRSQTELALSKARSGEEYRQALSGVLAVEKRLQSMVENLLLLTRLQAGQDEVALRDVSIPDILRRSWKPYFQVAEEKELEVTIDCDAHFAPVKTSVDLLEIVFRNLFDNAVTYTENGGQIEIQAARNDGRFEFRVANTNPGLRKVDLEKMFGRFWRASEAREGDHLHAGIGLALLQRIASALGGSIGARLDAHGMLVIVLALPEG